MTSPVCWKTIIIIAQCVPYLSGLDDSRNTAKLAYRMIQDGCIMKVTKTLKVGR